MFKKARIRCLSVVVVIAMCFSLAACGSSEAERTAEYKSILVETIELMRVHAYGSNELLSLTASEWQRAINGRRDFNVALNRLFELESVQSILDMLYDGNAEIIDNMRELQNPPEQFTSTYETLLELYDIYTQLHNLAVSPTGSLQTFNATRNDLVRQFNALQTRINVLLP